MAEPEAPARAQLKVSIFGVDSSGKPFKQTVTASELTPSRAKLVAVQAALAVGEILGVNVDGTKGRFRVIWVGEPGSSSEGEVRIENLEPDKRLWKVEGRAGAARAAAPAPGTADPSMRQTSVGRAQRRFIRYICSGGAKVGAPGTVPGWTRLKNISLGGCYLETASPMAIGTPLNLQIGCEGLQFQAAGIVKCSHPGFGMGVEFTKLANEARASLEHWSAVQPQPH